MHLILLIFLVILAGQNYHVLIYDADISQCLTTFFSQKYDTTIFFVGNILKPYYISELIIKSLYFLVT